MNATKAGAPRVSDIAAPLAVGAFVLLLWQVLVTALEVPDYLVPSPLRVARALVEDRELLAGSLWVTLKIMLAAFLLAVIAGTAAAFLFVQSRWIERSLFPYAVLLQVSPIVAIAPLVIIWIKDIEVALLPQPDEVGIEPVARDFIQRTKGFVHQQQLGIIHQRSRFDWTSSTKRYCRKRHRVSLLGRVDCDSDFCARGFSGD